MKMKQTRNKSRLTIFVLLAATTLLMSCTTNSSEELTSLSIYQTEYLELPKGQPVQTKKGIYIPQLDETWVSLEKYRQKEAENIALATQVRKLTAEKDLK